MRKTMLLMAAVLAAGVAMGAATAGTNGSPVAHLHAAFFMPCPLYPAPPEPSLDGCNGFGFGQTRVATATQAVILLVGDAESSQADCNDGFAATTHTLTIDGTPVPIIVDPCRYFPPDFQGINPFFRGTWGVFYKYLINPGTLASGLHNITFTTHWIKDFAYSLNCTDPSGRCTVPAGTNETDEGQLLIE